MRKKIEDISYYDGTSLVEGSLIIEDGKIVEVDSHSENYDMLVSGDGCIVLPGFVNAHTHSAMTLMRSFADDKPLDAWLKESIFPVEARLSSDDVYWLTRLAILEYLQNGITSVFDMYFHNDASVSAAIDSGFRFGMCGAVNDYGGSADTLELDYRKYNRINPLISYRLGLHAEYTTKKSTIEDIGSLARSLQKPVFMHCSETAEEVEGCMLRYGMSPVRLFSETGVWDYGGGIFHGVHLSAADLKLLKRHDVAVVTCPASNLKLASGVANVQAMLDNQLTVGIGTDGAASNNALSLFREMYLVSVLAKNDRKDPSAMPPETVLKMATENGSKIAGTYAGQIKPGYVADLVFLNLNHPNTQPRNNDLKSIVYSADSRNVRLTMVAGEVKYMNGSFRVGETEEVIYSKCEKIAAKLLK